MSDLFSEDVPEPWQESICDGAVVLRQFATAQAVSLLDAVKTVKRQAPFRRMTTPGGHEMSVGLTSCGECGWVSDRKGYRYERIDPQTNTSWPEMPAVLYDLGVSAAGAAGFMNFQPDACLINLYPPGSKMGLHQDKDESDFSEPIVSVSLGVPANFQFGGAKRSDRPTKIPLIHGDVVVWGGAVRRNFHGVLTIRKAWHPLTGDKRINLTFRKAL